ncbi:pali-domain-containing protein [Rhodofomes roseus]|uniref:Pali-domain-containing protein n=1 Tax=Rhodofomes roseus TaxID=34475 RepID=A0ABQ8KUC1_9APHY|nr:pali-domain-containing protein [Rhodofomes roseus]KAH9842677.1 pali-domain-containing protein [Rhodofomes roseus]
MLADVVPFFILVVFVLLLLGSLSVPIIKAIFPLHLVGHATSSFHTATGSVWFGVWGYCISPVDVSLATTHSNGDRAISYLLRAIIAAMGFAFLALVSSLFMVHRRPGSGLSRSTSLVTLVSGILAALLTTVVFLVDVILAAVVRRRVGSESDGALTLNWGNAVWMALGSSNALWIALVGVSANVCCGRRYRYDSWQLSRPIR